jgi:hypothetical protein
MPDKIKVNIEGKEHEVQLPEGYISEESLNDKYVKKDFFESEVQRRVKAAKENAKNELKSDTDFFASAAKERGIPLTEDGKYKPPSKPDIDIDKIKSEVEQNLREKEIAPRDQRLNRLMQSKLHGEIIQAASAVGIKKSLIESFNDGVAPPIVNMVKEYFGYDEENDYFAIREGDKFRYSNNPNNSRPYMGAKEFLEGLKKQDSWKDFFEDTRQRGSNYQGTQSGGKPTAKKRSEMSRAEKIAYVEEYGQKEFEKLPA